MHIGQSLYVLHAISSNSFVHTCTTFNMTVTYAHLCTPDMHTEQPMPGASDVHSSSPDPKRPAHTGRVTSVDVAAAAGVSQSTVSRALRGDSRISDTTRHQVEAVAKNLGYISNRAAKHLREQKSRVVGVMVQDIDNAFYPLLLSHIHRELAASGYSVVLIVDPLHQRGDLARMRNLVDSSLDGLLITTATLDSDAPRLLRDSGIPVVLAVRSVPNLDVDIIESDNIAAGQAAGHHLLSLNHSEVAAIMGPQVTSTTRDRLTGLQNAVGDHLRPERIFYGPYSHESGYALCRRVLRARHRPTAIVAGNDVVAIGIIDAARQLGVDIPGELSVIGFDDIPMAAWQSFQLTTVRQDTAAIAAQAARRLIERLEHPHAPTHHDLFRASMTIRSTTGPAPSV